MVEIQAYSGDCQVSGRIDLGDRRLTDLLNDTEELLLEDVRIESLADGHVVEVPELRVARSELYAVVAGGPRGDEARRLHTHTIPVEVDLGPYFVRGSVHGTAASDPLAAVPRRGPWVPLTDAILTYRLGDDLVTEDVATLLVNRGLASSVVERPWR